MFTSQYKMPYTNCYTRSRDLGLKKRKKLNLQKKFNLWIFKQKIKYKMKLLNEIDA